MATAWNVSDVDRDVAKWVGEKLSVNKTAAAAVLADYRSNDYGGLAGKQRILCVLRNLDAANVDQQWSVAEVGELTYTQLPDMVVQARDELRRRLVKPHPSRFSSSSSEVVSIED